jgi:hypothetical protein
MEPEGSLPHSQELSTYTYPEPDQCNPTHPFLSLQDASCILCYLYIFSESKINMFVKYYISGRLALA